MHPRIPVESILLASLTVSPQISKTGFAAPITPHTRGPLNRDEQDMYVAKNLIDLIISWD